MSAPQPNAPPVIGRYRVIPLIEEGASADVRPHPATPEVQGALGFAEALPPDWKARAIRRLGELVAERRGLRVFLETCTKCGACTDKCHYYLGTADPKNMPVARQDLLRAVWRRHFTFAGRHFPWLVGARELDETVLEDWFRYFHQCSECRRCTVFCPSGIDTSEVTMAGREVLASIGLGQHYAQEVVLKAKTVGNNLGLKKPALADILENLEEDILEEAGVAVRLPLDDASADMLVVTPSADFFAEPHVDGLIGYAKVLHEAGIRWTFSSEASEAANFALFTGNHEHMRDIARRIADAAVALGTRRLVIGECGHAWRVAYSFLDTLVGPLEDFLDPVHPRAEHICEVTHALWRAGCDPARPGAQRRARGDLPRLLQRRPRGEHGRRARRSVHDPARAARRQRAASRRDERRDDRAENLLLRRRCRHARRRADGRAGEGRAAARAGARGGGRVPRRHPHGRHLRDLQDPVRGGAAGARARRGADREPSPARRRCAGAERRAALTVSSPPPRDLASR